MNKIDFIGDNHGHDTWKEIVHKNSDADQFVFVGDYFDAYLITPTVQIENFKDIIKFKEANPKTVTLLVGNHDFHYMPHCKGTYGGYSHIFAQEIGEVLRQNKHHLQAAWQYANILVTHAGVSATWYEKHFPEHGNLFYACMGYQKIADKVNQLWDERPDLFNFSGPTRDGNSTENGPLWIRPEALRSDPMDSTLIQIVGHTQRENISEKDKVFTIDALPREYLIWNHDHFEIKFLYSKKP